MCLAGTVTRLRPLRVVVLSRASLCDTVERILGQQRWSWDRRPVQGTAL